MPSGIDGGARGCHRHAGIPLADQRNFPEEQPGVREFLHPHHPPDLGQPHQHMDQPMDFFIPSYEEDSGRGFRLLARVVASVDGHTHIYQFPPSEADRAIEVVKEHVVDGRLHPYAGIMLAKTIREMTNDV
jgi:hypothetical protein